MLGTAGWAIPAAVSEHFPGGGTHLERYARVMPAVEINSSFHRPQKFSTYQRWAASVPAAFRFAVKVPKTISHLQRLVNVDSSLETFLTEAAGLAEKLEILLLQLPPGFAYDHAVAAAFFDTLRQLSHADVVIEPRHASWFTHDADAFLCDQQVARVAAHPVVAGGDGMPSGWKGLHYHRLHGAPRTYYSAYNQSNLEALAADFDPAECKTMRRWCIFDNTASGAALADANRLRGMIASRPKFGADCHAH